ncbi:TetR/AcrR family transcriptional regulator [Catellatospora tritici]|uniref:TetR/AcrR family transcriptional regulator n=1 Tax=Catellatospora tritici TaxID=2851566 RepID=UPI001C2D65E3|nr:TetR/AcrR family transcriptional regulator [Catellatospora tritici]MBV1853657.1 TetR family transcriptional regulator [Catellatospora tritici]
MPPPNETRRAQLADAAVALLAEAGVHGVTHRAVDTRTGLPAGTASNYFRSREALLVAAGERIFELHQADMTAAELGHDTSGDPRERTIGLIAGSLLHAATIQRARYLAIFELQLESLRRPVLAQTLRKLADATALVTQDHHRSLDLGIAPQAVPLLMTLYGGALFTLVTAPVGAVTPDLAHGLAASIVTGALGA